MNLSPEEKERFFDLAKSKEYLHETTIHKWEFLPPKEFLENGLLTKEQFAEIIEEITGVAPDLKEKVIQQQGLGPDIHLPEEKALLNQKNVDATEAPQQEENKAEPEKQQKKVLVIQKDKLKGKISSSSNKKTAKPTTEEKPGNTENKSSKIALDVNPSGQMEEISNWKKERLDEIEKRFQQDRDLAEKLNKRSYGERKLSKQQQIILGSLAMFVITGVGGLAQGLFSVCWAIALGGVAAYILNKKNGDGGVFIFLAAYIAYLIGAQLVDRAIVEYITNPAGFMMFAFGMLITLCFGNILGLHIKSLLWN